MGVLCPPPAVGELPNVLGLEFHERGRPWLLTVDAGRAMSLGSTGLQDPFDLLLEAGDDVRRRVVVVRALKLTEKGRERLPVVARALRLARLDLADEELEITDARPCLLARAGRDVALARGGAEPFEVRYLTLGR